MKSEAQRKQDYENGYNFAIKDAETRLGYGEDVEGVIEYLRISEAWYTPVFRVRDKRYLARIKTAWVKGYEQAMLDIKNGKIKLEASNDDSAS